MKMSKFFANKEVLEDFIYAFNDENVNFANYNITKFKLNSFLCAKKPKIELVEIFLVFYNSYYNTNYSLNELYDVRFLDGFEPKGESKESNNLTDKFSPSYSYSRFNRRGTITNMIPMISESDRFRKILYDIFNKNKSFLLDSEDVIVDCINESWYNDFISKNIKNG